MLMSLAIFEKKKFMPSAIKPYWDKPSLFVYVVMSGLDSIEMKNVDLPDLIPTRHLKP